MDINNPQQIKMGVVGLGLMGSSIAANFLMAGHQVVGVSPIPEDLNSLQEKIAGHLNQAASLGLLQEDPSGYMDRLIITNDFAKLADCAIVVESVIEDTEVKAAVFHKIEHYVGKDTIIGSNTSAIPISKLQSFLALPHRFLGLHWSEPAYVSRFLEIICGAKTELALAESLRDLAHIWNKEPILLRKDIRGFVTNRLMYAVFREGLFLNENNAVPFAVLDQAFRYDAGSWMTVMGIFERMDFEGLDHYQKMLDGILPLLHNDGAVPKVMQEIRHRRAQGIRNLDGLYRYTRQEAIAWDRDFRAFSNKIYQLAASYQVFDKKQIQWSPIKPVDDVHLSVLIIGNEAVAASLAICLAHAKIKTTIFTTHESQITHQLTYHAKFATDTEKHPIEVISDWPEMNFDIAFILEDLPLSIRKEYIKQLQTSQSQELIIAVACDYTPLSALQKDSEHPGNIIGANWTEPVHTTKFLELVKNENTSEAVLRNLLDLGTKSLGKDPCIVLGDLGVRSKLITALIREAMYIVQEGYAEIEDIDRACRNDGGTYLPFVGNCRYMDLMGTYAYAVVMQELNPDLSIGQVTPALINTLVDVGALGIKSGKGFYTYNEDQIKKSRQRFSVFSHKIRDLMDQYP
jgi:3-hydroxybutyryl-CoA dehydrogenase